MLSRQFHQPVALGQKENFSAYHECGRSSWIKHVGPKMRITLFGMKSSGCHPLPQRDQQCTLRRRMRTAIAGVVRTDSWSTKERCQQSSIGTSDDAAADRSL